MKCLNLYLTLFVLFLIAFTNGSSTFKNNPEKAKINQNKKEIRSLKSKIKFNDKTDVPLELKGFVEFDQIPIEKKNVEEKSEIKKVAQNIRFKEQRRPSLPEYNYEEKSQKNNDKLKKNNDKKSDKINKNKKNDIIDQDSFKKEQDVSAFKNPDTNHIQKLKNNEKLDSKETLMNKKNIATLITEKKQKDTSFTRIQDYFKKTSKSNQSVAGKALAGFLLGFILYFGSIHLICWNERRAVREYQYIEFIKDESKCKIVENGAKIEKFEENLVYIIKGDIKVTEEAKIPDLDVEFNKRLEIDEKIILLQLQFEKFSLKTIEEKKDVVMEDGEEAEEIKTSTKRTWSQFYDGKDKLETKIFHGKTYINDTYQINLKKLEYLIESNQTQDYNLNKYIYLPHEDDKQIFEEYFKTTFNTEMRYVYKNQYIYILSDTTDEFNEDDFNPEDYKFTDSDYRFNIKYYYLKDGSQPVTFVGGLKSIEDGKISLTPFDTKISIPGCSYLCCCCAESGTNYTLDEIFLNKLDRCDVANKLEEGSSSTTCSLRVISFLLHFGGIYLILYPLILLIGMIPFIGAIGATILIFFAFILSLCTFLFIIACSWVCARPLLAFVIYGIIFILFFFGKSERDAIESSNGNNSHYSDKNSNKPRRFMKSFY